MEKETKQRKGIVSKRVLSLLLSLAMVVTMALPAVPAKAEEAAAINLTKVNNGEVAWGAEVNASLNTKAQEAGYETISYKVGEEEPVTEDSYTPAVADIGKTVTFTAKKAEGEETLTASFTVTKQEITGIEVNDADLTYDGSLQKPALKTVNVNTTDILNNGTPKLGRGDFTLSYDNNTNAGTATATVAVKGTCAAYTGSAKKEFTIAQKEINSVTIADIENQTYTGEEIKPELTVTADGLTLAKSDYKAEYADNTDVGTAQVTGIALEGTGNFTGEITVTKEFEIVPATAEFTVSFDGNSEKTFEYGKTYSEILNDLQVKNGDKNVETTDYEKTVTDQAEIKDDTKLPVGTYTLNITGKGNYTAESTGTIKFTITAKTDGLATAAFVSEEVDSEGIEYTGKELKPEVKVDGLTLDEDFKVEYVNNTNAADKTHSTAAPKAIVTFIGNYQGAPEQTLTFTIKAKSIATGATVTLPENQKSFVYNGKTQLPTPIVKIGETTLTKDVDFTVAINGDANAAINVGENKEIQITGTGNYTGTVSNVEDAKYTITPKSIDDPSITVGGVAKEYPYVAKKITPEPVVMDGETTLALETDYTLGYGENTNTGEGTVTIIGANNYDGRKEVTFTIGKRGFTSYTISTPEALVYTGLKVEPAVTVKAGNETVAERDYKIVCSDKCSDGEHIAAGEHTFQIVGQNDYVGLTLDGKFTIKPRAFKNAEDGQTVTTDVKDAPISRAGTGNPEVVVEDTNTNLDTLVEGKDYTVEVIHAEEPGATAKGTVEITGKGNYAETTVSEEFGYSPKALDDDSITAVVEDKIYTGKYITLKDESELTLMDGETPIEIGDYEISSYSKNKEAGTATVTITATKKNKFYQGERNVEFTIAPKDLKDEDVEVNEEKLAEKQIPEQIYNKDGIAVDTLVTKDNYKQAELLTFGGVALSNESDYEVVVVKADDDTKTSVNSLTDVGTYNVIAKAKEDTNFTGTKVLGTIKVKPAKFDGEIANIEPVTYTAGAIEPTVTIEEYEAKDYKVSFEDNTNVGTAKVFVEGDGNYEGGKTYATFEIKPMELKNATVEVKGATYTGSALKPAVTVKANGVTVPASDYEVVYTNNTNAGEGTVTVKAKSANVTGEKKATFTIAKADLKGARVSVAGATYTGSALKPAVSVKLGNVTLNAANYSVAYANNIYPGTARVTVTGKGNCAGTSGASFTIKMSTIKKASLSSVKKAKKKQLKVTWKKDSSVTGYQIKYSTKKSMKSAKTKTISKASTTKYTIKKLKAKKKYYVQVREYKRVNGVTYYGSWSSKKSAKTK